jgi:hypothetical protein
VDGGCERAPLGSLCLDGLTDTPASAASRDSVVRAKLSAAKRSAAAATTRWRVWAACSALSVDEYLPGDIRFTVAIDTTPPVRRREPRGSVGRRRLVCVTKILPPVSMTIAVLPSSWPLHLTACSPVSTGAALVGLATQVAALYALWTRNASVLGPPAGKDPVVAGPGRWHPMALMFSPRLTRRMSR